MDKQDWIMGGVMVLGVVVLASMLLGAEWYADNHKKHRFNECIERAEITGVDKARCQGAGYL